jgi:hypothetical protein
MTAIKFDIKNRKSATVAEFIATPFGNRVLTTDGEMLYTPEQLPIEAGVVISYTAHKAGETHTMMNGKDVTFKKEGIHDIMCKQSANVAVKIAVESRFRTLAELV